MANKFPWIVGRYLIKVRSRRKIVIPKKVYRLYLDGLWEFLPLKKIYLSSNDPMILEDFLLVYPDLV